MELHKRNRQNIIKTGAKTNFIISHNSGRCIRLLDKHNARQCESHHFFDIVEGRSILARSKPSNKCVNVRSLYYASAILSTNVPASTFYTSFEDTISVVFVAITMIPLPLSLHWDDRNWKNLPKFRRSTSKH